MSFTPLFTISGHEVFGHYNDKVPHGQSYSNPLITESIPGAERHYLKPPYDRDKKPTPYVIANELVCATLANQLGILVAETHAIAPTPENAHGYFASKSVEAPTLLDSEWDDCNNCPLFREDLATLIAFDVWVLNRDRSNSNMLVHTDEGGSKRIIAIDHAAALFNHGADHNHINLKLGQTADSLISNTIEDCVFFGIEISKSGLINAAARIATLSPGIVQAAVNSVPKWALSQSDKSFLISKLDHRRKHINAYISGLVSHEHFATLLCP